MNNLYRTCTQKWSVLSTFVTIAMYEMTYKMTYEMSQGTHTKYMKAVGCQIQFACRSI